MHSGGGRGHVACQRGIRLAFFFFSMWVDVCLKNPRKPTNFSLGSTYSNCLFSDILLQTTAAHHTVCDRLSCFSVFSTHIFFHSGPNTIPLAKCHVSMMTGHKKHALHIMFTWQVQTVGGDRGFHITNGPHKTIVDHTRNCCVTLMCCRTLMH